MSDLQIENILAIDPGPEKSGFIYVKYVSTNIIKILDKGYLDNELINKKICLILILNPGINIVIEGVVAYGMAVGKSTLETAVWSGRFFQKVNDLGGKKIFFLNRKDVRITLCNSMRAKTKNINQALKDRFGEIGTKNNRGKLYDIKTNLPKGALNH
ncbi:unnamed protein product, partial [marine sediment metagenome]